MNVAASRREFGWAELAITLMGLTALVFLLIGEDTEASLFGLSSLGLLVGRVLGIPRRALFVLAVALAVFISTALLDLVGRSVAVSVGAHLVVSGLLAWGLAEPVSLRLARRRAPRKSRVVLTLVGVVVVLGMFWEVGEHIADSALGTSLSLGFFDTLADFAADALGALLGSLVAVRQLGSSRTTP